MRLDLLRSDLDRFFTDHYLFKNEKRTVFVFDINRKIKIKGQVEIKDSLDKTPLFKFVQSIEDDFLENKRKTGVEKISMESSNLSKHFSHINSFIVSWVKYFLSTIFASCSFVYLAMQNNPLLLLFFATSL